MYSYNCILLQQQKKTNMQQKLWTSYEQRIRPCTRGVRGWVLGKNVRVSLQDLVRSLKLWFQYVSWLQNILATEFI